MNKALKKYRRAKWCDTRMFRNLCAIARLKSLQTSMAIHAAISQIEMIQHAPSFDPAGKTIAIAGAFTGCMDSIGNILEVK